MMGREPADTTQLVEPEWISFPGGELEGRRPKTRCAACRARSAGTLCFLCYRADFERQRRLAAAAAYDSASEARFESSRPFEPVDGVRLRQLRRERQLRQAVAGPAAGGCAARRRRAQRAARQVLAHPMVVRTRLPASWLPFVGVR
jgi:hypothetical protein